MRNPVSALFTRRVVLGFTAAAFLSIPAWGQRPPIRRVSMTVVKPDRIGDFEAAVKQFNEAYAKVPGGRSRTMFQSLTGQTEYMLVRDYDKWSDLDAPNPTLTNVDLARINVRIMSCFQSMVTLIEELKPELSSPTSPSEPPTIIRLARSRIRPEKVAEWESIVKNELLPAYVKAGAKSITVRKVRFGGPNTDYYISTRKQNWADAGANELAASMGADAYKAMVSKLTGLSVQRELNLYRYRADLTYHVDRPTATATR
jgi:hypothetical protein